jgi:hypothetical protein
MGVVGGSRHYAGGTLGQEGMWNCPACGEENAGPIAQGCASCGSGRPGYRATAATPPPRPAAETPSAVVQGDVADYWATKHANVTIAEAYRAGYLDGIQAARAATRPKPAPREAPMATTLEARQLRTFIIALEYFRDQFLQGEPEEVQSGEWCSASEITTVIQQLQQQSEASRA